MKTIKNIRYMTPDPLYNRQRLRIVAMCHFKDNDYILKQSKITRVALQQIYDSPSLKEPEVVTIRQTRLKLILNEALDIAHYICEHHNMNECILAWEVVDEIDDAASRAGVTYN